jgi:NAD(P)-dependent dehydrogenase (short-subunit alcohol dehydrogenase family)
VGRDADALSEVIRSLEPSGARAAAATGDAADPGSIGDALDSLREQLGPVGVLVYNAASYTAGPPSGLPPERLARDYAVNVTGALAAVQHVLPDLLDVRGTAILTGGGAAVYPSADFASLSLTKSGLRLLTRLLFEELNPLIHVTTVTIQGGIGSRPRFAPDAIAETYLALHRQPVEEWTAEFPYTD